MSGADRKKLRKQVKQLQCGEDEEVLEAVLPSKQGELEVAKVSAPSRMQIYLLDKTPVFVDLSGKGDLIPTVFTLWRAPDFLPHVYVKHPTVSKFLINGADLMAPGVDLTMGLNGVKKESLVCVCVPGNPAPVGVGSMVMSPEQVVSSAQMKGKLVEIYQAYGDQLWSSMGGGQVPNMGFLPDVVVPIEGPLVDDLVQSLEAQGLGAESAGEVNQEVQEQAGTSGTSGEAKTDLEAEVENETGPSETAGPDMDMDSLLELSLLQALHTSVGDNLLPLTSSVLWNQHMLPLRPPNSQLDLKKSKHKKLSKFLMGYAKGKLLDAKEDRHSGEVVITKVHRKAPLYVDFTPYLLAPPPSADSLANSVPSSQGDICELLIEEVYKPCKESQPVFSELGLDPSGLYKALEVGEVAWRYVEQGQLRVEDGDDGRVVLDAVLCDALYKGVINVKKGERYPETVPRSALENAFLSRMQLQTRVTRGGSQIVKKGALPLVSICADKRQGNKRVTRVSGLETFLVPPEHLSSECQRRFACSSTVQELPGKHQGQEVVVQGNLVEKVADFLVSTYGVPKKYVQVKKL